MEGSTPVMVGRLQRIADSSRFQNLILGVIVLNAITLGLQTYDVLQDEVGSLLTTLDEVFLGVFVVEMAIRVGAHGSRPQDFFRQPWNLFDFTVVAAAFVPGLRGNATLLRLVRLLRVVRVLSVLPDLRVLIRGMLSSLAPIGSLTALAVLVMYVYGMLGWILFGDGDPARWGDIGQALLTLFVVMTLETWPEIMGAAMEVTSWAWVYFVTYVLVASFLIINVVIAIIITAIEEAHREERAGGSGGALGGAVRPEVEVEGAEAEAIRERLASVRSALEELEAELGHAGGEAEEQSQRRSRIASKGRLKP